ncbi:MAG TPA: glycosyltransferase family 39 protein, partial [Anaerolineae bacterium]|nr:glycosyltransferase family 39 protein [Anaerolineae bacterium]
MNEWSLRLGPALVGVVSLPLLYIFVRKVFDKQVALIAMALLAISPWHLFWSQNARFYTTLLLMYLVALFAFFWGMENNRRLFLLLSLVMLGLAMLERMLAAFLVPVIAGYLVLLKVLPFDRRSPVTGRILLAAVAVPIFIFALYDTFQIVAGGGSKIEAFLVKFVGQPNKSSLRLLASYVYHVGIPVLCVGGATGLYLIQQKRRPGLYLLVSAVLPPLALTLAAPFVFTADRYAFVSLPGWLVLSAVGIKHSLVQSLRSGHRLMLVIPLIVVAHALVENVLYYQYQHG